MSTQESPAVAIGRAHIKAWSHHDWDATREQLAPDVHAVVTNTQPQYVSGARELTGIEAYMQPKIRASQLIEPGSVRELSAIGDGNSALITMTMRIGLGPGGSMVTLARAIAYLIDDHRKIKEERDMFFVLS